VLFAAVAAVAAVLESFRAAAAAVVAEPRFSLPDLCLLQAKDLCRSVAVATSLAALALMLQP